jgi:endonuclease/exonuclease/phosphatase (EEP) superfamily protein YafD
VRKVLVWLGWFLVVVLLPGAGVLTLARLRTPTTTLGIQLQAVVPWAMPAYALALLLAIGVTVAMRSRWRVLAVVVALVAAAGLGAHVSWFLPQVTGEVPQPAADAERMTVMTANLYVGRVDERAVWDEVTESEVDVLVLEEATDEAVQRLDELGLADLMPYRAGLPVRGVVGTVVVSRHRLGEAEALPGEMSAWSVPVRFDGGDLFLVAAHPGPPQDPERWREEHATLTAWALRQAPALVVGDLNATADHVPMRRLSGAGYRSVTELTNEGWRPTWPAGSDAQVGPVTVPPLAQVDHVLCGPDLAAVTSRTVDLPGGDHRGVVAVVARR